MADEIELKLALPPAAVRRLRRHPLFIAAAPLGPSRVLDNRYLDTPARELAAAGIALRTRRDGRLWLRTVKIAARSVNGLSRRPEWEVPCPADPHPASLDFSDVDVASVGRRLARHAPALREVFATRFRRETRRLRIGDGVSILLMLDRGEIRAGRRREPICELELELERGRASDLRRLAATLCAELPLRPEDRSKAERGHALAAPPTRPARTPSRPRSKPRAARR